MSRVMLPRVDLFNPNYAGVYAIIWVDLGTNQEIHDKALCLFLGLTDEQIQIAELHNPGKSHIKLEIAFST